MIEWGRGHNAIHPKQNSTRRGPNGKRVIVNAGDESGSLPNTVVDIRRPPILFDTTNHITGLDKVELVGLKRKRLVQIINL